SSGFASARSSARRTARRSTATQTCSALATSSPRARAASTSGGTALGRPRLLRFAATGFSEVTGELELNEVVLLQEAALAVAGQELGERGGARERLGAGEYPRLAHGEPRRAQASTRLQRDHVLVGLDVPDQPGERGGV